MKRNLLFVLLLIVATAIGCSEKNPDEATSSGTTPPSVNQNSGLQPPYDVGDSEPWKVVEGVQIYMVEKGSGPQPAPGSQVIINYQGRLTDGSIFDSSFDDPGVADFNLNQLIKGWQVALSEVPAGSKVQLVIPPEMGYGGMARPGIPANSTLVFDIELISTY